MSARLVRFFGALAILLTILATLPAAILGGSGTAHAEGDRPDLPTAPASVPGVQFVQVATAANIVSNWTIIDHPLTNGNPNAILFVTPNWNPGNIGGTYNNHPIGVWYNGSKWAIFNQDLAAMPLGAAFNVLIPTPGASVFVHKATAGNSSGDYTEIDNPLTNGNPNALLLVTPNWNPGNVGGTYNNHSTGVFYHGSKWAIFNQDLARVPLNAAFNVYVLTAGTGVFVHKASAANSSGDFTTIDNPLTNGSPNALVFVTPNWNPGGEGGTYNNHATGVAYDGRKWAIFNQDLAAVPVGAAFNVLVLVPGSDQFVHTATADNSSGDYTEIDNPLTNGSPNAIVFVTPNWNPGGEGGVYNNHSIGVWYDGSKWAIFNQDLAPVPAGAAFNVLVPNPDTSVFVHTATAANSSGDSTTIDNPLTNGNPRALLLVTPNWNPGGVGGVYNNHPIGVWYTRGQWAIFNQDLAPVPSGAAFNVLVLTPGGSVFVHKASAANSTGDYTVLDNARANGNPNAIVFFTPNWNPGGTGSTYNNRPTGAWYDGSHWAIFNQDFAPVPPNAAFNVYVYGNNHVYQPLMIH